MGRLCDHTCVFGSHLFPGNMNLHGVTLLIGINTALGATLGCFIRVESGLALVDKLVIFGLNGG